MWSLDCSCPLPISRISRDPPTRTALCGFGISPADTEMIVLCLTYLEVSAKTGLSLSLSPTLTHTLSLSHIHSISRTYTLSHTHSLSHTLSRTHTLSLSVSLSYLFPSVSHILSLSHTHLSHLPRSQRQVWLRSFACAPPIPSSLHRGRPGPLSTCIFSVFFFITLEPGVE